MRVLTKEIIDYINLFEAVTKAKVKDCIIDNYLLFIVEKGEAGRAIGRGGIKIRKLSSIIKKRIKVVEFDSDVIVFIKNLIYPISVDIKKEDNLVTLETNDSKTTKGLLIGRNRKKIEELQNILSKYFKVKINVR